MEKKPVTHFVVGIIIGLVMIVFFLAFYFTGNAFQKNAISYLPAVFYIGAIIYFVIQFAKANNHNVTFGNCFSYGFKASAVVALIMAVFLTIFIYAFPDYKEGFLQFMNTEMEKTNSNLSDEQKETTVAMMGKFFNISVIGGGLFMNLLFGAIASLIGAAVAKKKPRIHLHNKVNNSRMDVSIVVPLFNEDESLPELCAWIERVVNENELSYEIILVDDGSTDESWFVIEKLISSNPAIKGIKFQRNYGKSAALNEGFKAAKGDVVITMDADLQDSPDEIPELRRMIVEGGYDLVSGWKKKRYDNKLTKNIPSKIYNAAARRSSGIYLHDFNCGLKAYKKKVVKSIEVYGEMHRYIPVLAKWAGFKKIGEKVVEHRPRKYGTTKFGLERFVNGFLDLSTITFVSKFGKSPMHFFGLYGTLFFLAGFGMIFYLIFAKIVSADFSLTNRPSFYIALTTMIIGMQLFLAGFVAELISRNSSERNSYLIEKKLELFNFIKKIMGATIIKVDTKDLQPTKKQLELQKKLLAGPTMTEEEYKEFKKNNKWMGKWKI